MDPAQLRKKVFLLDKERRRLYEKLTRPLAMISGSLYQISRTCGNPRCKCARGKLHRSWYLSRRKEGRTRLIYIGSVVPEWLSTRVSRYKRYQRSLAAVRKIDREISEVFNQLRDEKIERFEAMER